MRGYENILFDLDGTLVDHFEAIHKSFSFAARSLGVPEPTIDKVRSSVGGSVPITAKKLFLNQDPKEVESLYREEFENVKFDGLTILPGAREILKRLNTEGKKCFVFTNKNGDAAREVCSHLRIEELLIDIVGTGDTPYRKPQKEFSDFMLQNYELDAKSTCLIGDSPFDAMAADVISMDCYLVATGSHSQSQLRDETEAIVFRDLFDLGHSIFGFDLRAEA